MNQVLDNGKTDAMKDIQEHLKDMIVYDKRERQYNIQMEFQKETEQQIDQRTEEVKKKVEELEKEARKLGLNPDKEEEDIISVQIKDPKVIAMRKKKVEKDSIKGIHRKFYSKFKDQKERLELKLSRYNEFFKTIPNTNLMKKKGSLININAHPLIKEFDQVLEELRPSLPKITSKLPWNSGSMYKPRSTSGSIRYSYTGKTKGRNKLPNSKSVNEMNFPTLSSDDKVKRKVDFTIDSSKNTIESLRYKETGKVKPLLIQDKTPYLQNY